MSEALTLIERAMRADVEALRIIGQNVANAEVTAYRRQVPLVSFPQLVDSGTSVEAIASGAGPTSASGFDPRPGTLRSTGEPLHVALDGPGFFVLQAGGQTLLTRRGDFHVAADGILKTAAGEIVLGLNGAIHVGVGTPVIDVDGSVRVGADVLDRLRIVQVGAESALQYVGNGSYLAPERAQLDSVVGVTVRQGFLETSNVTPIGEMVQMMEVLRHFEASQRFVRGYDQLLEKAISELGRVT